MRTRDFFGLMTAALLAWPSALYAVDTDADGLDDAVETNTGVYVSPTDTGTNPNNPDSDGDGAGDWYEVAIIEADPNGSGPMPNSPNDPNLHPNVPYPLPAPDSTPPATNRPVKVFILSGQSNMQGKGKIDPLGTPGTLSTIVKTEHKFPNLHNGTTWAARGDVTYRGVITCTALNGPLAPGQGSSTSQIGPELGFGHVMGYFHDEPVLVIKSSQGGRALGWDFLPPGSVQYTYTTKTYAGYGESPASWTTGSPPTPTDFYGGYQYDQCFLDEADWAPPTGAPFPAVVNVTDVLDNFATLYPQWAGQGFEIEGFGWFHGWNDGLSYTAGLAYRYETNMVQFIKQIRQYYENRYPGHIRHNAPFVVATAAFNGWDAAYYAKYPTRQAVVDAQLAVGDPAQYPEFAGNVKTMEARGFWRDVSVSPGGAGYHYNLNAETFMLVGDALGRGMIDLLRSTDYTAWSAPFNNAVGGAGIGGPGDDYDGDGQSNDKERIWGLDPTSGTSRDPVTRALRSDGTFTYTRRNAAVTGARFSVWTSTDLQTWTEDTGAVQVAGPPNADNVETVTVTLSAALRTEPKLFVHVRYLE